MMSAAAGTQGNHNDDDLRDRVRDAIGANVEAAYGAVLGSPLVRKAGAKEPVARCPFHDDTHASLRVNLEKTTWFCDPCGKGGDLFNLGERFWALSFPEALNRLATLLGVAVASRNGKPAGDKPKPKLVRTLRYPICDINGAVVATHLRYEFADGSKSMPWDPGGVKPAQLPLYLIEHTKRLPGWCKDFCVRRGEARQRHEHSRGSCSWDRDWCGPHPL